MKKLIRAFKETRAVTIVAVFFLLVACNNNTAKINISQDSQSIEQNADRDIIWHIKALHPDGKLLDVKAIDKDGKIHDVKAIQNSNQISILDVKAFVDGKILPVKVLVSEDDYLPVKAIDTDGTLIDIKALSGTGKNLDIKGVRQSGSIIDINVINENNELYNIEAISPKGWVNDVKGIKMLKTPVELIVNGVEVFAHIKCIPQVSSQ